MTPEQRARLRDAAEKATPGEWRATKFSSVVGCPITTQPDPTKNTVVIAGVRGAFGDDYRSEVEANAAWVALSQPKNIIALLDALDAAAGEREAMMFAATDLICAQEERIERLEAVGRTLADTLRMYGYPVSDAHWKNASGQMSAQARALHLAAESFRAALAQQEIKTDD